MQGGAVDHYNKTIGNRCGSADNNFQSMFSNNCQLLNAYDLQEHGVPHLDVTEYVGNLYTQKAVNKIKSHNPEQPFLMHFHLTAPHAPLQAPQELLDLCTNVSVGPPEAYQLYYRQIICGMVASVDINILQVLLALSAKDMLRDTLVLFQSDNGGMIQAGSLNSPYRGGKAELFEGGIRVPAFMYGSMLKASSRIVDDLVHVTDILPTILGYAEIDVDFNKFDGINHWTNLKEGNPLTRNFINVESSSELMAFSSSYIHRFSPHDTWKYIQNPTPMVFQFSRKNQSLLYEHEGEFLFHISSDPQELHNLALSPKKEHQDMLNMLRFESMRYRSYSGQPQLVGWPPIIDLLPSKLGCWLPLDSPYYDNFDCNVRPNIPSNVNSGRGNSSSRVIKNVNTPLIRTVVVDA
jgi:hypothetical protein